MSRQAGRPKTGGRKKGTPNKSTLGLQEALEAHGIDVVAQLSELIPTLKVEKRADVLMSLMTYLYPKRRSIELPDIDKFGRIGADLKNRTEEEIDMELQRLEEQINQIA